MIRAAACRLAVILVLAAGAARADDYPARTDPFVNDTGGIIDDAAEGRIRAELRNLRAETGVEATVLTLPDRTGFAPAPTVEAFATRLFNAWGIGGAGRNDGLLLLVVTGERAARLELGAGYGQGYDVAAEDIVARIVAPALRDGTASDGIAAAAAAMADRIGRAHAAEIGATEPGRGIGIGIGERDGLILALFGAAAAAIVIRARRRHGAAGATAGSPQASRPGEDRDDDRNPDRRADAARPEHAGRDGDAGGGGRSDGGGATGRW